MALGSKHPNGGVTLGSVLNIDVESKHQTGGVTLESVLTWLWDLRTILAV